MLLDSLEARWSQFSRERKIIHSQNFFLEMQKSAGTQNPALRGRVGRRILEVPEHHPDFQDANRRQRWVLFIGNHFYRSIASSITNFPIKNFSLPK